MELGNVYTTSDVKYCPRCQLSKAVSEFGKKSKLNGTLQLWCKACQRKYDRERYKQRRDELLGQKQAYAKSDVGRGVRNEWARKRDKGLRLDAVAKLGGRCANVDCRWLNEEGTLGCTDTEVLHIDHKAGGGNKERKTLKSSYTYYKAILSDLTDKYQLLCANCNWKKRYQQAESFGDNNV